MGIGTKVIYYQGSEQKGADQIARCLCCSNMPKAYPIPAISNFVVLFNSDTSLYDNPSPNVFIYLLVWVLFYSYAACLWRHSHHLCVQIILNSVKVAGLPPSGKDLVTRLTTRFYLYF